MEISISSGNYEIIKSGTVYAFSEHESVTFHFIGDETFGFDLKIDFKEDETGKQSIERSVDGQEIRLMCVNFKGEGTGLNRPVKLAQFQGKSIYFKFWNYLEGGNSDNGRTRKIEYTFLQESRCVLWVKKTNGNVISAEDFVGVVTSENFINSPEETQKYILDVMNKNANSNGAMMGKFFGHNTENAIINTSFAICVVLALIGIICMVFGAEKWSVIIPSIMTVVGYMCGKMND